jgi:hypothetical protein
MPPADIPCRCAVGLACLENRESFQSYAWNEVYISGRWVALDALLGQSQVDAAHIKISDTSLAGFSSFAAFEALSQVFNKMTIEPREIR